VLENEKKLFLLVKFLLVPKL